jgi:CheY-like chemotaxis protein
MSDKKILIIDDQPEIIEVIKELIELDYDGVQVDTSEDPNEGLDKIKQSTYKVICTDLNMPVINGLELIKQVRDGDTSNKNVPFIIITGDNSDLNMSLGEYDNVKIVNKAENIPELLTLIGSYVG